MYHHIKKYFSPDLFSCWLFYILLFHAPQLTCRHSWNLPVCNFRIFLSRLLGFLVILGDYSVCVQRDWKYVCLRALHAQKRQIFTNLLGKLHVHTNTFFLPWLYSEFSLLAPLYFFLPGLHWLTGKIRILPCYEGQVWKCDKEVMLSLESVFCLLAR